MGGGAGRNSKLPRFVAARSFELRPDPDDTRSFELRPDPDDTGGTFSLKRTAASSIAGLPTGRSWTL